MQCKTTFLFYLCKEEEEKNIVGKNTLTGRLIFTLQVKLLQKGRRGRKERKNNP